MTIRMTIRNSGLDFLRIHRLQRFVLIGSESKNQTVLSGRMYRTASVSMHEYLYKAKRFVDQTATTRHQELG